MKYRIRMFVNGRCTVPERFVLHEGNDTAQVPFYLYVYIIEGGEKPVMIETTCKEIDEINRQAKHVMGELVTQTPDQTPEAIFKSAGIDPKDVSHVFITHFHYDHCSNLELFPNAQVVISAKGHHLATHPPGGGRSWAPFGFLEQLAQIQSEGRLQLAEDGEILPGIRLRWIGGHTWCDTCIFVDTPKGTAAIPGDTVMVYRTIEENIPPGLYDSLIDCLDAIQTIKANSDFVLPSHDPEVLERWPGGVVG